MSSLPVLGVTVTVMIPAAREALFYLFIKASAGVHSPLCRRLSCFGPMLSWRQGLASVLLCDGVLKNLSDTSDPALSLIQWQSCLELLFPP